MGGLERVGELHLLQQEERWVFMGLEKWNVISHHTAFIDIVARVLAFSFSTRIPLFFFFPARSKGILMTALENKKKNCGIYSQSRNSCDTAGGKNRERETERERKRERRYYMQNAYSVRKRWVFLYAFVHEPLSSRNQSKMRLLCQISFSRQRSSYNTRKD